MLTPPPTPVKHKTSPPQRQVHDKKVTIEAGGTCKEPDVKRTFSHWPKAINSPARRAGTLVRRPRRYPAAGRYHRSPFIVRHDGWWYLFASFDFCCRGAKSTYSIRVGRSQNVTGPYVDKAGIPMLEGGGSIVIEATTPNWRGPGHQAILQDLSGDYLVFHAYHGQTGRPELKISIMVWETGWPRVAALP